MSIARLISYVDIVLFGALAVICLRTGRHRDTRQALAAAVSFGLIGVICVIGLFLPEDGRGISPIFVKAILVLLLASPVALYRFSASFEGHPKGIARVAVGLTTAAVVFTVLAPRFPLPEEPQPMWIHVYAAIYIADWVVLSAVVAHQLWTAGRGLPSVTRHRMHTLSAGAAGLALAVLPSLVPKQSQPAALQAISLGLPIISGALFALGFAPPLWLRTLWRSSDQAAVRHIELDLIRTDDRELVVSQVLPHAARLVGGDRAVLYHGPAAEIPADAIAIPLSATAATLVVQPGPYTPFFGHEEVEMVSAFARFFDLVLDRTALLANERAARQAAETSRRELETLVYGLSHDLKSPLISLLGHLDVLRDDHAAELSAGADACLVRMESAASYMDTLLTDLLDLARIGRLDSPAEDVDLGALAGELRLSAEHTNPRATVEVGSLPLVVMNAVRARQLLTNLVENALRHAGREDVTICLSGAERADGSAVLDITDDGVGIPGGHQDTVFEMFERLPSPAAERGAGLGLAVCRRIVETVGGDISMVDAQRGAHIRVVFPPEAVRSVPWRLLTEAVR